MNQLTPSEIAVIQMALQGVIEDLQESAKAPVPFTPEARKQMKEITDTAQSALAKIAKVSGRMVQMDPYQQGDEKEFLTKES